MQHHTNDSLKIAGKNQPLVSVITPVYNAEKLIRQTVESVLGQTYPHIEYIVVDGGSSDGTLAALSAYRERIASSTSEPDSGMYDALVKGIRRATGEIVCYINAGDFLHPYAVDVAIEIFKDPACQWLTGCRSKCNERGVVTRIDLPFRYRRALIRTGSYGRILPSIQQESTFFRASLLSAVDLDFMRSLKMAGDYYLWWCFAARTDLQIVSSPLGVFRRHKGQLSEQLDQYFAEFERFVERRGLSHRLSELYEKAIWALHPRLRAKFAQTVLYFDDDAGRWTKRYS